MSPENLPSPHLWPEQNGTSAALTNIPISLSVFGHDKHRFRQDIPSSDIPKKQHSPISPWEFRNPRGISIKPHPYPAHPHQDEGGVRSLWLRIFKKDPFPIFDEGTREVGSYKIELRNLKGERRMKINKAFWVLFFGIFFLGFTQMGFTQTYPAKTIRVVVPSPAGSTVDLIMRVLQKPLGKELGGKVIVEDITGGNYKMGTMEVMNATPDGYTLLYAAQTAMIAFYYGGTYDFKVWEKLTTIAQTGEMPLGFFEVRSDSPFKTWADLVSFAKKNPGQLTCGGPGARGQQELVLVEAAKAAGIQVKWVPFTGSGPTGTAILGGQVDFACPNAAEALIRIKAGQTRGLAVPWDKRYPEMPDVPTFKELGLPVVIPPFGFSFFGPPNLPGSIVNQISKAVERALKDKEYIDFTTRILYQPLFKDAQAVKEANEMYLKTVVPKLVAAFPKLK
jgi:tripartite-type tricarboxylate transporter receptor subunit TctC